MKTLLVGAGVLRVHEQSSESAQGTSTLKAQQGKFKVITSTQERGESLRELPPLRRLLVSGSEADNLAHIRRFLNKQTWACIIPIDDRQPLRAKKNHHKKSL